MSPFHSALIEIDQKKQQLLDMLTAAQQERNKTNFFHADPGLEQYMKMLNAQLNILAWVTNLIQT
jgi:hypothetical protein